MHLLVIVSDGYDRNIEGMTEVIIDGADCDIYNSGVIQEVGDNYKSGVFNMPDLYEMPKNLEFVSMCSCDTIPEIAGDTFVNIQHKVSSVVKSAKDRLDEFVDGVVSNCGGLQFCVAHASSVYDTCITCSAFPPVVSEIKDYATKSFIDIIKKLNPTMTIIVSRFGVRGVSRYDKSVREYNGKLFTMSKSKESNQYVLKSGIPTQKGRLLSSTDPGVDIVFSEDVVNIILSSMGLREPTYDICSIVDYDTIMTKHLESFGYA